MVNSHPTIRQLGFDLPRQQWCLLNRFRMEQGHCGACRRKWRLTNTDLCPCGETQTMSHIVESCPLTKLNGGLSRLHSADEDAASWVTSITVMVHDTYTRRLNWFRKMSIDIRRTIQGHWCSTVELFHQFCSDAPNHVLFYN